MKASKLFICIVTCIVLMGCSKKNIDKENQGDFLLLTDALEREVKIPPDAERILCLNSELYEMIFALGAADKIINTPEQIKNGNTWLSEKFPETKNKPVVQNSSSVSVEEVLKLEPQIILTTKFGDISQQNVFGSLKNIDIPIFIFSFETIDTYFVELNKLVSILNLKDRGTELKTDLETILSEVTAITREIPEEEKPKAYFSVFRSPYFSIGDEIFEAVQFKLAGAKNVTAELRGFGIEITAEQLNFWNPDYIIAQNGSNLDDYYNDEKLKNVTAIKENQTYTFPESGWEYLTPRSIIGIAWLAKLFHPGYFSDFDITAEISQLYKKYYSVIPDFID